MSSRFAILLFIVLACPLLVRAQSSSELNLIAYRQKGVVLLRWAPSSASVWLEANRLGYTLERYTIIRDSVRVYPPEQVRLGGMFMPAPLSDWANLAIDDNYAALTAQAIYGDGFSPEIAGDQGVLELIQLSREQDMRFSFALLAADQSFDVALLAGLGVADTLVNEQEVYLYKLYANGGLVASDTAYAYVGLFDGAPLPQIQGLNVEFGDKIVSLTWRQDYYEDIYSSYLVEKSTDGVTFTSLNDLPSITAYQEEAGFGKWMMKTDSLAQNNTQVYYRVRGKTPFGIIGPPSEIVSGTGRAAFVLSLGITEGYERNDGVFLKWSAQGSGVKDIDNILVERATDAKIYSVVDTLEGHVRTYSDPTAGSANYYRIVALRGKDSVVSLPYFVQREDSIPPAVPEGLNYRADPSGQIILGWKNNTENDLYGYRVFRSNIESTEYRQVTVEAVADSVFIDSLDLRTLSRRVYYKVMAVDNRGNRSALSASLEVELPDITPPVPPRITNYKVGRKAIDIAWVNSTSDDVARTELWKEVADSVFVLESFNAAEQVSAYRDTLIFGGEAFYFLIAEDSAGNRSAASNKVMVSQPQQNQLPAVELLVRVDRKEKAVYLEWADLGADIEYRLYKAKDEEPISLLRVLDAKASYTDKQLEINTRYRYRLQIVDKANGLAKFSKQVEVVY